MKAFQGVLVGRCVVAAGLITLAIAGSAVAKDKVRLVDSQAIVDAYEYLYQQPRRGWSFEVDVRTAIETW